MTTMTISVPEIHCDHCKHSIEGALAPLPGVASARVDVDARTVTVEVDETLTDRGAWSPPSRTRATTYPLDHGTRRLG
jgi:copper chaperone